MGLAKPNCLFAKVTVKRPRREYRNRGASNHEAELDHTSEIRRTPPRVRCRGPLAIVLPTSSHERSSDRCGCKQQSCKDLVSNNRYDNRVWLSTKSCCVGTMSSRPSAIRESSHNHETRSHEER